MTLEQLNKDSLMALKMKDTSKRSILTMVIANIKRAAIDAGIRDNIDEAFVDQQLTKYIKNLSDIKTSLPADQTDRLAAVENEIAVVKAYAPTLISDPVKIKEILDGLGMKYIPSNRGTIMKAVSRWWKGQIDMKAVTEVLNDLME